MNERGVDERGRLDDFYARKWGPDTVLWEERYAPEQRVYAESVYRRRNRAILEEIADRVEAALDVGCGVGDVALLLCGRADSVTASDLSAVNVVKAREVTKRAGASVRCLQSDARRLPFEEGSFDLVVLADVIEHISDPERALFEIARVLRPHGRLICVTPLPVTLGSMGVVDSFARGLARLRWARISWTNAEVFERFLGRRELRRAIRGAGLRIVRYRPICFYPAPETGGAFGGLMTRLHRRVGPKRFDQIADGAIRLFLIIERLGVFNQKQLWVAER